VSIVTAVGPAGPAGMTCSSVVSVSLEPPLVLFCPSKSSTTWSAMRAADHFAVNVLGGDAAAVARRFATRGDDRFAGTSWRPGQTGSPLLGDAIAWIECRTTVRHDGGDHEIVIGGVVAVETQPGLPLVFHDGELFALSAVDRCGKVRQPQLASGGPADARRRAGSVLPIPGAAKTGARPAYAS
jgi:3-hydroxy-9,10-secoandrosta-1,3,5(10)-triene-9,17-dione monooxygenase reductase component